VRKVQRDAYRAARDCLNDRVEHTTAYSFELQLSHLVNSFCGIQPRIATIPAITRRLGPLHGAISHPGQLPAAGTSAAGLE